MVAAHPGVKGHPWFARDQMAAALPILLVIALPPGVLAGTNACMLDTGECVCEGEDNARCLQLAVRADSHDTGAVSSAVASPY